MRKLNFKAADSTVSATTGQRIARHDAPARLLSDLMHADSIAVYPTRTPSMDLPELLAPIVDDMAAVDALIHNQLRSDVVLINQIGQHITAAGGKRLRPALVALAGQAVGLPRDTIARVAAIIEFIHTATLLHDDVVDASDRRRGRDTANALWGNAASVLTGDFLYSRAFQLMVDLDDMAIMRVLADTTNAIAEGEVLQLMHIGDATVTEQRYLDVIDRKTARLFAAATQVAMIAAGAPPAMRDALRAYGQGLGMAFQLVDDALDYTGDDETLGKRAGDDLAEGKPTLPLLHVLAHGDADAQARVRHAIEHASAEALYDIRNDVQATGAIDYTLALANQHAETAITALDVLDDSAAKRALAGLAHYAVSRDH